MAAFLRAAASRARPFAAAAFGTATAAAAAAGLSWTATPSTAHCAGASEQQEQPRSSASEPVESGSDVGGAFGIYFDDTTQQKIRSAFPPKYPVLRAHKVLVNAKMAAKLERFAGCDVKMGIECYVDDGDRQMLQLRVLEPEYFGDVDLSHDKAYVVLSSKLVEDCLLYTSPSPRDRG